ncbi:DUF1353 domain-containing protein [Lentilitoribacter sp. EG35]|uniref:DUF1353 domain-containing protein n=1 Tax=Lentilitoribacter sp. EG35 TaxID=3234192 RepID=UPI00345FEF9E
MKAFQVFYLFIFIFFYSLNTYIFAQSEKCTFSETTIDGKILEFVKHATPKKPNYVGGNAVKLLKEISYTDCSGEKHIVEQGTTFKNLSIPIEAWNTLGYQSPWSGKLQRPVILHDHLCRNTWHTSEQVHQVFFEALQSEGVDKFQSLLLYSAAYLFGPQWAPQDGATHQPKYRQSVLQLISQLITGDKTLGSYIEHTVAPPLETGTTYVAGSATVYYMEDIDRTKLTDDRLLADIKAIGAILTQLSDHQIHKLSEDGIFVLAG